MFSIAAGIAIGYGLDGRGELPGKRNRFLTTAIKADFGSTQPPI
jgi:hypothetical protein